MSSMRERLRSAARVIVKRRWMTSAAAVAGVAAVLATAALATPGASVVGEVIARAGFTEPVDVKIKLRGESEVIHVVQAGDTVMQRIVFGPGGHTGWHSHPGPAIALVKSGELTLYSSEDPACTPRTFGAGQAFVDSGQGHVHLARNSLTSQNTEVWVTYLDVPPGRSPRIDAPAPGNCGF